MCRIAPPKAHIGAARDARVLPTSSSTSSRDANGAWPWPQLGDGTDDNLEETERAESVAGTALAEDLPGEALTS